MQGDAVPPSRGLRQEPLSKPACPPALQDYVDEWTSLEGSVTASNGFIEYSTNLPRDIETQVPEISIPYGFESVWHKAKKYYSLERIKILKEKRTRETLIALRDMNLISIEDMCDVLAHDAYMQTNYGAVIKNELGERVTITRGRYNLKPGARPAYIQKRLRNDL